MTETVLQIIRFHPQEASDKEYDDYIDLLTRQFHENKPDDPSPPRDSTRRRLETIADNPVNDNRLYLIRDEDDKAIAQMGLYMTDPSAPDYDSQKEIAYAGMYILRENRKKRIGTQLLKHLVDEASANGVKSLEFASVFDSGKAFAKHIGATVGLIEIDVEAYFADMDWQMIDDWVTDGQKRNPDTQVIHFQGLYSDDDAELTRFAEFETAIRSDMPDGELDGFIQFITADKLRKEIEIEQKRGIVSDYMLAVEADGRFSGFTRINYQGDFAYRINQRVTGVLKAERGRGLGKWLKAAMLKHIQTTYPDADLIRTSYADVNDPMMSINDRLGFKPYEETVFFKLPIDVARQYLETNN